MKTTVTLALAQYPIDWLDDWQAYTRKIDAMVQDALTQGAEFLVFPEYFSMELTSLFGRDVCACLDRQLDAIQAVHEPFVALFTSLAQQHGLHILAGTFPLRQADGHYRNRAWLFRPDGSRDYQDKLQMTRFESERWQIQAGEAIKVLDTAFGKVGVAVCYDSEFPQIARRQVEQGADLILVPSCTDTQAGYHRVRIGCQARALENQCFVAQSPTIGSADWSESVDVNTGRAGIFAPVDYGYPDDGVVALGDEHQPGWVVAELDLAALADVRTSGQVFNHRDWDSQFRFG
ncbi:carbon-nitrogen hydrolase family protein [Marinobacterium sediminicola]|uniref:Predicted amidohydrolase n=1 Tax=Marinobacterium sediminicola TaxID=518898 RepID=A0ABY1S1P1_9GAMM|nr:carbon-nitrogen hydrolase family protein [Marinobacterium sediminicola]ULG69457.1 carbon-nitrogen hydrolase family protein [Marinobacterium sediminicola]SMR75607.1 Predicted amidohydrolase [Marinobacterium sediminicola]